jgi:hypothetical protein
MPPVPAKLSTEDRTTLVDAICRTATSHVDRCLTYFAPARTTPLAISADDILRAVDRFTAPHDELAPATPAETLIRETGLNPRIMELTPSLEMGLVLLAQERCPAPDRSKPESMQAFKTCVGSVLDRRMLLFPEGKAPTVGAKEEP